MNNDQVARDTYDPHIVPAETAARKEREGDGYKQTPEQTEGDIDTTGGYTTDKEGLINNFAIEPEMYYEVPGDLKAKEEAEDAARAAELHDINDNDETGKLTMEKDERGKGSGII
ncbi:MAG: hypothetical protein HC881_17420 [Leptolyngbyaceae cyanobacterium SL_7_1]|nr:hypothetical protein [Leptolyngbyaceae cyanobacterium SL_7_1]